MFRTLTMRGVGASISWAYYPAARLCGWTVTKSEAGSWTLTANVDRADPFKLKQQPLYFNAPRKGGFFTWPVLTVTLGREQLTATLGPPEN